MKDIEVISKVVNRDKAWQPVKSVAPAVNLSNYVNITGMQEITGEKNFTGGLKVNGCPIVYDATNKYWKLEGDLLVTGGVTMYGNEGTFTPSTIMDAIVVDGTTISKEGGILKVIGSVGGAITLGSLANVGSWADSVANQDRIMYQAANSSQWVAKNLSDLAVGGVTGNYLPLSGGTINGSGDYLYVPLYINALNNQISGITFKTNGAERGHVGYSSGLGIRLHSSTAAGIAVSDSDVPIFYTADGAIKNTIWHSGNDGSGSGLDADLLDGYDNNSFFINRNIALNANTINTTLTPGCYYTAKYSPINGVYKYGTILNFRGGVRQTQFYIPDGAQSYASGGRLFFRDCWNAAESITTAWYEIVTSASVGYCNAGSATKLQTARTIWGQSFDGTGNVDGRIRVLQDVASNFTEDIISSFLVYSPSPYGLVTRAYNNGNVSLQAQRESNSSEAFSLILNPNGGNVGIGTTSPSQKLHVAGNILATGGVTMYSARKLKNITDERGLSLEELSVIKPTRFTWKDGRDNKVHIGGIADDVQKVLPEVIYKADNDTLTMDYGNAAFAIAASLIKPVVSHEERIKVLEEENKRLKEEIEQLKWTIA